MALWNPVSVVVTRPPTAETRDGAGGWNMGSSPVVYSGLCDLIVMKRVGEHRDEADPGINTQRIRLFKFDKPVTYETGYSGFLTQDIIAMNGQNYTIMFVWNEFRRSVQAEGWVMV